MYATNYKTASYENLKENKGSIEKRDECCGTIQCGTPDKTPGEKPENEEHGDEEPEDEKPGNEAPGDDDSDDSDYEGSDHQKSTESQTERDTDEIGDETDNNINNEIKVETNNNSIPESISLTQDEHSDSMVLPQDYDSAEQDNGRFRESPLFRPLPPGMKSRKPKEPEKPKHTAKSNNIIDVGKRDNAKPQRARSSQPARRRRGEVHLLDDTEYENGTTRFRREVGEINGKLKGGKVLRDNRKGRPAY